MTTKNVEVTYGKITEKGLNDLRAKFGKPYYPELFHEYACKDAIRSFCYGIGDRNPLFIDEDYAKKTKWGTIIASPFFVYAITQPQTMEGLPGVHAWYCAVDVEWFHPIRLNDKIAAVDVPFALIEKHGRVAGLQYMQWNETTYTNQKGEVVCKLKHGAMRAERDATKEKGKYMGRKPYCWSDEELEKLAEIYDNEEIRKEPRYWEDVTEGEELRTMAKGPFNGIEMESYWRGVGLSNQEGASAYMNIYIRKHPQWAFRDPVTRTVGPMAAVHNESSVSKEVGIPLYYDLGVQRFSWCGNYMSNWVGPDGFVKKLDAQCRLFNMVGDVQFFKGKVVKKYIEGGEHLVTIDFHAENQLGETTTPGHATVVLTSKSKRK